MGIWKCGRITDRQTGNEGNSETRPRPHSPSKIKEVSIRFYELVYQYVSAN